MTEEITVLLSEEEIRQRLEVMAQEIDTYYQNNGIEEILIVCILKGSLVFTCLLYTSRCV